MEEVTANSGQANVNDSTLGDNSPKEEYVKEASKFINGTSLDKMHEIAEKARMKKLTEPAKLVIPDDI